MIKMTKLNTEDAIIEQLANGNKLRRIRKNIEINLENKTKVETVEGEFAELVLPDITDAESYREAETWYESYIGEFTSITVIGRSGRLATLPYSAKDKLSEIVRIFNT